MKTNAANTAPQKKKFEFNNTIGVLMVIVLFAIILSFISKTFLTVDNFVVVIESDGRQQMVYKHAISTVIPMRPIDLGAREEMQED